MLRRRGRILFIGAVHEVARERAQSFLKPEHSSCRCQGITVSGWTTSRLDRQPRHRRESQTQKIRSRRWSLGSFTERWRMTT